MAYFANGSEGDCLDAQCDECHLSDEAPCPVLLLQMTYNYEQVNPGNEKLREAMNTLVDENGQCQMKQVMDAHYIATQQPGNK